VIVFDASISQRDRVTSREPDYLLLQHLFNLADLLLDFAGEFFVFAFGRQFGVVRNLSGFLFEFTFHVMQRAFDLILRARFHLVFPLFLRELSVSLHDAARP
jgi:hypothetical protein